MIRPHRALPWLALAALVLRCLFPPGYMPEAQRDGRGLRVVLCSGAKAVAIEVDADGAPIEPTRHAADTGTCPFAALAFAAAPPPPPLGLRNLPEVRGNAIPTSRSASRTILAGALGPRAPPHSPDYRT
jgi:hypothetical protein